ncbi:MAG TPA: hypothetical protein PK014_01790 [Thermoanaerobaculia bacterium]|nr:hypothetical protein [Thermoanaerobaculia bacterium]HXK66817.1 hypothetical protein [Thermoanaerobaculia bacterium]
MMSINRFYSTLKTIKIFIQDHPDVSEELASSIKKVEQSFRATYTSESFKEALMANADIPSDLEEEITSASILYNNEKARL